MKTDPIRPSHEEKFAVVLAHTDLTARHLSVDEMEDKLSQEDLLARVWHYEIPSAMRAQVAVGQLVWVSFGKQYLQGIITAFDAHSPVMQHKPIDQIVDLQPVLTPEQIGLARWISETYLTPMYRVVETMLPPGMAQQTEVMLRKVPGATTEDLSAMRRQIVDLAHGREIAMTDLGRQATAKSWRGMVRDLVGKGVLSQRVVIKPPTTRPRLVLAFGLGEAPSQGWDLTRRQQEVVDYLARRRQDGHDFVPKTELHQQLGVSDSVLRNLVGKGAIERSQQRLWRDPLAGKGFVPVAQPKLTPSQERVWDPISHDLDEPAGRPFLLQGVTGSGKTEIYMRAVSRVLEQGRGAIVLVPEIALTPQTIRRFGARFPETLAVMHSGLSAGERYDQWHQLRAGELCLVVGVRSAVFAPVLNLGLIVLDEEHEWTYKQENAPRYHTRDVAVELARRCGATCILGSATPAIESAYRAERGEYTRLVMPERIMGHRQAIEEQAEVLDTDVGRYAPESDGGDALYTELPPVEIVDMRAELRAGNATMLSRSLHQSLLETLGAKQQAILFLNRRGTSTFVMCRDCGHVLSCPRCELPLTYHGPGDRLVCHHCQYSQENVRQCPECYSRRIRYFGAGTEKVEAYLQEVFPPARIVRWDVDTTGGKHSHEKILDRFIQGEADILVGTQMVAKGLDLPRVTLVGVIAADTILNLPDMRASERTFQLLTQVAGRAGRSILGGKVIIQTYKPKYPAVLAAAQHDYQGFYEGEMAFRREHHYPPLSKMIRLILVASSASRAQDQAHQLADTLRSRIARLGLAQLDIVGPAPAFFARERGKWRWHIVLRGVEPKAVLEGLNLPVGWRIDVDPISLL